MFVKEETSQIEQRVKGKYKDVEARQTSLFALKNCSKN